MRSSLSERQRDLLMATMAPQGRIVLLLDNDEAGRNGEAKRLADPSRYLLGKVIRLPEWRNQPDELTDTQVRWMLAGERLVHITNQGAHQGHYSFNGACDILEMQKPPLFVAAFLGILLLVVGFS